MTDQKQKTSAKTKRKSSRVSLSKMNPELRKEKFISLYIINQLSQEKVSNKELATKLEISEQYFYKLLKEYREEINKIWNNDYRNYLRQYAFDALVKKLKDDGVSDTLIEFTFQLAGDLPYGNRGNGVGDGSGYEGVSGVKADTVIINVANDDNETIQQRSIDRIRRRRIENLEKLKG